MSYLVNPAVPRGSSKGRTLLVLCLLSLLPGGGCNQHPAPAAVHKIGGEGADSRGQRRRTSPPEPPAPVSEESAGYQAAYGPPVHLADLEDQSVTESSGVVASRTAPGYFWTHNDSGDGPFIYAFDQRGRKRGVWQVKGAKARDWEDIAAGPGPLAAQPTGERRSYLYVGDIGDNGQSRSQIVVYRFPEPQITPIDAVSTKARPRTTEQAEAIRLQYPDGKHDAEALLVHPTSGDIYIVTKRTFARAVAYRAAAPLNTERITTLERLGEVSIPSILGGIVTGGSISPDGRRVVLCDYGVAYEWLVPSGRGSGLDKVWQQQPTVVAVGARQQGEAICYSMDGEALLMTSERLPAPLYKVQRGRH